VVWRGKSRLAAAIGGLLVAVGEVLLSMPAAIYARVKFF
jgi:hypothetical protein